MAARSPSIRRRPLPVWWVVGGALLVVVPTAAARPSQPSVSSSVGSTTNAGSATFSWTGSTPDPGHTILRYEGGIGSENADFGLEQSAGRSLGAEGTYTFRVRAVEREEGVEDAEDVEGPYDTVTVVVDRTPPQISATLSPSRPNGENGWYRSLEVDWTCRDPNGSGVASCPSDETVTRQGAGQRRSGRAQDRAGNVDAASSPSFNLDAAKPNAAPMRSPSPGAVVATEPIFVWGPAPGGETSGFNRYEVLVRIAGTYRTVSRVAHSGGATQYSATRDPRVWSQPLPKDTDLRWYVRTYDNAGNSGGSESQSRAFRISSTAPGPPTTLIGPPARPPVIAPTRRRPPALPRQNAKRLRPRAGKLLLTRRPVLRWTSGPRGTRLYNLQVFRVTGIRTAGKAAPRAKKVYSVFPKARRYRVPKVGILAGTCYVWRVWPFVANRFTARPLGVSNFCIASAKRLRQEAVADAERRAAKGR